MKDSKTILGNEAPEKEIHFVMLQRAAWNASKVGSIQQAMPYPLLRKLSKIYDLQDQYQVNLNKLFYLAQSEASLETITEGDLKPTSSV